MKYDSLSAAIGWTKKKLHMNDGQTQRWLDHDTHVSFTLKQRTSMNAEFIVNGNPNHTIWYSQLAEIFILLKDITFLFADITRKDGTAKATCEMDVETFMTYVQGKTFRVSVNPNGEVAKFDKKALPYGITYENARKLVSDLTKEGKYEEAAKYLLPATLYDLYEV